MRIVDLQLERSNEWMNDNEASAYRRTGSG